MSSSVSVSCRRNSTLLKSILMRQVYQNELDARSVPGSNSGRARSFPQSASERHSPRTGGARCSMTRRESVGNLSEFERHLATNASSADARKPRSCLWDGPSSHSRTRREVEATSSRGQREGRARPPRVEERPIQCRLDARRWRHFRLPACCLNAHQSDR